MTFEERMIKASEEAFNNKEKARLCVKLVEGLMGVEKEDFLISRTRNKVLARHLLHYALRAKTTMTLEAIGKITARDHATVSHSVNYIEDYAKYDGYIGVLKKCIDKEIVPELFKTRDLFIGNTIELLNDPKYNSNTLKRLKREHGKRTGCEINITFVEPIAQCGYTNDRFDDEE